MRKFSSYGPVDNELHYYVPRKRLIEKTARQLIGENPFKGGSYITVWASRQCGKTWIMREVLWKLKKDDRFNVVKLNLESLKAEKDPDKIVGCIADMIVKGLRLKNVSIKTFMEFGSLFSRETMETPLILIMDEFDVLPEEVISGLAGIFRNIYIERSEDQRPTSEKQYLLHSVALIGVRSVLGVENVKGSPFNVQRSLHVPGLTHEEVSFMFRWYEQESGQKVEQEVIDRIFYETQGQPGLVSWFGELLTEGMEDCIPEKGPVTSKNFERAYKFAVHALPNNNILNIISKVRANPYRDIVIELFKTGKKSIFTYDDPYLNFLFMIGVIDREEAAQEFYTRFSCPFLQKRLFNYFSREISRTGDYLHDPFENLDAIITKTDVNIVNLIGLYQKYLEQNRDWLLKEAPRRKTDLRIFEAVFHFDLYMYLKIFFQDKGGKVFPEFPTGNGKVDIIIRYGKKMYALELKSFKDLNAYKKGLIQAAEYGSQLELDRIFLIFFTEGIDDVNRQRLETEYENDQYRANVKPLFVETGR